jgi:uncharacterized SAM-binding protein YcdF (DUF218 family)
MAFLYNILLKLFYPTSLAVILLVAAAVFRKRKGLSRVCYGLAVALLLVCGNGLIWRGPVRHLERQYLPSGPLPHADCILILSGGLEWQMPPRPTVEVGEAGDRLLYGAYLYRQRLSPLVICTGGIATGGWAPRAGADEMREFLSLLGLPKEAILTEGASSNTHEHAVNLELLFRDRKIKRVLLVTSAMHMPRSLGVFHKSCPNVEFVPAPTDFRLVDDPGRPWYRELVAFIPTPQNLVGFSEMMHEYVGMAYYRMRGWM